MMAGKQKLLTGSFLHFALSFMLLNFFTAEDSELEFHDNKFKERAETDSKERADEHVQGLSKETILEFSVKASSYFTLGMSRVVADEGTAYATFSSGASAHAVGQHSQTLNHCSAGKKAQPASKLTWNTFLGHSEAEAKNKLSIVFLSLKVNKAKLARHINSSIIQVISGLHQLFPISPQRSRGVSERESEY